MRFEDFRPESRPRSAPPKRSPTRARCCSTRMFAGGEKHRITALAGEPARALHLRQPSSCSAPDARCRAQRLRPHNHRHRRRIRARSAGDRHDDLVAPCGRTSTSRSRTNSPGASRCRRRSRRSAGGCTRASAAASPTRASSSSSGSSPAASSPNANLVPESSIGWDAGWEQTFWNGRVVVDVTYFNSRLENEIVLVVAARPVQAHAR